MFAQSTTQYSEAFASEILSGLLAMSLSYTVRTDRYLQERGSKLNMPLRQYCELLKKVEVLNKKDPHWSLKYRKAIAYCA